MKKVSQTKGSLVIGITENSILEKLSRGSFKTFEHSET